MSTESFQKVADVSEVPSGTIKVVKVGGADIMLVNIDGGIYAHSGKCTHAGGPVGRGKLNGSVVQCPWHGSKFDVKTGAVVGPPARVPLAAYEVKVDGTAIWVKAL